MQKFTYDRFNRIEVPTFVLSNVYHHQIGVLTNIDIDSIDINFNMNSQQEISLDVYKELNGEKCELWDEIVSLRYIFVPEHKEYYKIEVTTDDENKTTKHLVCSSASEYELSNKIIRSLEINTETDILRNNTGDDSIPAYAPNVLYNPTDPSNSILNRILADKAPDWSIGHVDSTIANIQRTFSISNQKIYDCLTQTIAKEYDCLFVFDSVNRTISAYDLLNYCRDCGKRGEFTTECPKCGSTNIQKGYGKDTHIFITYNNFSEKITVDGDEGAVKNCFAVQGGDDYMSSTVKNINPNGSEYIYNFSTADYKDMPQDLINKLESYQDEYNRILPAYQAVTEQWYNAVNDYWYYKTSMMPRANSTRWEADTHYDVNQWVYTKTLPSWCHLTCIESSSSSKTGSVEFDCTSVLDGQIIQDGDIKWRVDKYIISVGSAEQQLDKIVEYFETNKVYFKDNYPTSITVVSNEVKNIAGLAINSLFKIDVVDTPTRDGDTWIGTIKVYNTGNQDDKVTETISVPLKIVASLFEYTDYLTQQVDKRLHKADLTYDSVLDIEIPRDDDGNYVESQDTVFKEALTEYALDSLSNFEKSYNACIQTLANNGIKDESSEFMGWNMYDPMYLPYWTRLQWIQEEMAYRETTVNHAKDLRDSYADQMRQYNKDLDLQAWLGDRLFKIFWSYVREDTYQNSNYISTGLSDGEVINDAKQLLEIAQDELKKVCELQITLNDDISNLLNTEEFKDYKDKFNIGDYIVCEADETIYRLRLISVSFSYSSPDSINLTFSNFTKITNFLSDAQSVISSAQSISGSYNAVMHQVIKNANTTAEVDNWKENGIASSSASVFSNEDQEVIIDQNGILARSYDDTKDLYSPKQFRITNNRLAFTDDDWKTTTMGIGELEYDWYNEEATTEHPVAGWNRNTPGYGVDAKFVTAGVINGSQIIGGQVYSNNYTKASGTTSGNGSHIDLTTGEFSLAGNELYAYIDPQTGKYVVSYKGDYEGHADVDVGSTLGVWTVAADGFAATNAYLKPNGIAVTGNVSAPDYIVGSGANAWTLSEKMASKQDVLTAGANITIQPVGDNLVISATGGGSGTEVIPNPVGTPTDTLNTVEIDGVIYDIVGGSSGLQYFVETQTSLYGQNTIDDELRRNGNYRFNHAVSARYNLHEPFSTWGDVQFDTINDNGEVVIAVTWERTIITSLWSQSTGEDNGIMVITTDPTVCGLNATDRTSIYQTLTASYVYGDFTDEQSHYDSIGGWVTSTFTYEGTTYYVMLCHNNTYKDWSYEADSIKTIGSTLHYKDDRGIYSSVAEFALAVFTMNNTGQTISSYSGLHQGDDLAFFAGGSDSNGTDAPIKIFTDGTTEGLVTEEDLQDYAKLEDLPQIEANPSETPTDVLNSINIDGTAYEIQGGGGGSALILNACKYSTDEQVVGIWTDGKPLYQKSWVFNNLSSGSNIISAPIPNLEKVVSQWGTWERTMSTGVWTYDINAQNEIGLETRFDMLCRYRNQEQEIYIEVGSVYSPMPEVRFTIQYTKTTDSAGSGGYQAYGFSPIIYSEEEREVGVWTDNKPLYQKTWIETIPNASGFASFTNNPITNLDKVISTEYSVRYKGQQGETPWYTSASVYYDSMDTTGFSFYFNGTYLAGNYIVFTARYTKTADVAGSGSYTTLGVPAHHYDGNEKIVGTWYGETLYEKTINTTVTPPYSSIDLSSLNIGEVVGFEGCSKSSGGDSIPFGYSVASGNQYLVASFEKATSTLYISLGSGLSTYNNVFLTIRYTKTT